MNEFLFAFILIQLIVVAWLDIRIKLISNYWFGLNFLLFILLSFTSYLNLTKQHFYFPLFILLFGFLFFLLKIMGAGDSKYLSSLFLIIPDKFHLLFFQILIEATLVVGTVFLMIRVKKNYGEFKAYYLSRYWSAIIKKIKSEFSFAPVILIAWIILGLKIW